MNFGPANNEANKENVDPHPRPQRKYSFESLKQTIYKKFESLTRSSHKQHSPSSSSNSLRESLLSGLSLDEMHFRPSFNVFQPSLVNTIEVPANIGFNYGANVYNQKNNMIITCPSNSHVHFYDASSFAPLKKRSKRTIDSSVVQMSYCDETDTHLMGCAFGDIYSYNATSNTLNKVMKQGDSFVLGITYITPNLFAFSSSRSNMLYFGDVNSKKAEPHYSLDSDAWYLHNIKEKNLLLSGLANGMIAIYNTKKAPKYPMVDSLQAHRFGKYVTSIINITIKGRDYLITGGNDHTVKIWHFYKGKMRLLKNITTVDDVSTIVYLEEYKMIATTHHKDFVKFFRVPSGALVSTLPLGLYKARNIFLMPDKNLLGVADLSKNVIKVVQLHPNAAAQSR